MMQKIIPLLLFILSTNINAQDLSFFTISSAISDKANAVIQYSENTIELVRQDKMTIKRKAKITIYNDKADGLAELELYYDKRTRIGKVKMEFHNAVGKRLKKVSKKDFDDYAATGSSTLYSDNRVLYYRHIPTTYPYTVTYEYEIITQNTAFIPRWLPISNYDVGVVKSTYSFSFPNDFKIQKLEANLDDYDIHKNSAIGLLKYSISNIAPIKHETLSPHYSKILPNVRLASNKFELAGVKGTAETWSDFGKWMYNELLASQNNLSEETIAKIKEMVKGIDDPTERAKVIYEYVQNKTRYINVAIDIGGWQPMKTSDVDRLGYGDCKALTFYTKSLLDIADVPSYYSIVYAGSSSKNNIEKDIVCAQGNHAFLCLPREKDTIWLECTSQKVPFGLKNSFTDDRDILAMTAEGGKIVHTCTNKPKENLQQTIGHFILKNDASIEGTAEIISYGTQYSNHLYRYDGLSPDDLEKRIKNHFDHINNLSVSKIEVHNNKTEKRYEETLSFTAENYSTTNADKSILFNLNTLNRILYIPSKVRNRKTPFEILRGYKDSDTYTITIPDGYSITDLPAPKTIENQFGVYTMSVEKKDNSTLIYTRSMLLNKGLYPKEMYKDYRTFWKKINRLENIKIIISK